MELLRREETGSGFARRRCLEKGEGVLKGRLGTKGHEAEPEEREDRDHGFERAPARVSEHAAILIRFANAGKICASASLSCLVPAELGGSVCAGGLGPGGSPLCP
jgi:hypothetical protein